jgi:hypothetical protein
MQAVATPNIVLSCLMAENSRIATISVHNSVLEYSPPDNGVLDSIIARYLTATRAVKNEREGWQINIMCTYQKGNEIESYPYDL